MRYGLENEQEPECQGYTEVNGDYRGHKVLVRAQYEPTTDKVFVYAKVSRPNDTHIEIPPWEPRRAGFALEEGVEWAKLQIDEIA